MAVPVPKHGGGNLTLVGQPIEMSRTPAKLDRLLPEAGADNEDILTELGFDHAQIDALRRKRAI